MAAMHISDYPQLLSTLSTSDKIVYLCGAGASMALGGHRLSWPNWILAGKDYLTTSQQLELDNKIGAWTTDELINAVTYLLEQVKASGSYQTFMEQTIGSLHPTNAMLMEAFRKVWRAGDFVATTNYDVQIEETLDAAGVSYAAPAEILSVIRGTADNKVIHLHGMYDRLHGIDDIIADDPQYKGILANAGAQFIQNLISTYPIVIVGCGGTVEDPNLAGFMSFVVEKLGVTNIPYFYLMKQGDIIPNLPANAIPIFYGDDYPDLPAFLSELTILRLQQRIGLRSVISVNPYVKRKIVTSAFGRMHFSNGFNCFVGRAEELNALNEFLVKEDTFSWWSILGEGGIGKSRLILEWMKKMPSQWFGFFARMNAKGASQFVPFTDTVIAFDYIVGQEEQCAETIEAFYDVYASTPYKLRIILVERRQRSTDTDWLKNVKRTFSADFRLEFEQGAFEKPALTVGELNTSDEIIYTENYLNAYLPLVSENSFIHDCKNNRLDTAKRIQEEFRASVDEGCYRPLYLSIFVEVWLSKEGRMKLSSTEELLSEYLNKEKQRWKIILEDDALVDSYLRVLAVACAIGMFNITDVNGDNYLKADCDRLISYFDEKSGKPGADNLFTDLFVSMDELVVDDGVDPIASSFLRTVDSGHEDNAGETALIGSLALAEEEQFAYLATYIKLQADPNEVYLQMLVNVDAATDEEREELKRIREDRIRRVAALPDHAWIVEPIFPDIVKEYIVSYAVNERDVVRFTRVARANSILGLANFLALALEDWPDNKVIQKIAVTPPEEKLNYFEYYVGLMSSLRAVKDIEAVEKVLLESEPLFQGYELELWRRISVVLTEREDIDRLFESGLRFIEYLKGIAEMVHIRDEAVDALEGYCIGLYNSEDVEKTAAFLEKCCEIDQLVQNNERLGVFCCENYGRLIHLKLFKDRSAVVTTEWKKAEGILAQHGYSEALCKTMMAVAYDYMQTLTMKDDAEALQELESDIEGIYQEKKICEVAEIAALCAANIVTIVFQKKGTLLAGQYEKIKVYFKDFPQAMRVRSAFVSVSNLVYARTSAYRRVPEKVINHAKAWALQYPNEIEFQESYFGLLLSNLQYAQANGMRNEQRRVFREMKAVAEKADYSAYKEGNQMMESIRMLQQLYGY